MPVIPATQEAEIKRITVECQVEQVVQETLYQKTPTQKRGGGLAQVLKHLSRKREALSSGPSTHRLREVAQAFKPIYLSEDQEDHGLRPTQAKSFQNPHLYQCLGMLVHTYHPIFIEKQK
jgi:hypothetical protein